MEKLRAGTGPGGVDLLVDGAHPLGTLAPRVAGIGAGLELDALPLAELVEGGGILHGAAVEEDVPVATIRGDEAEATVVTKGLDGSLCHGALLLFLHVGELYHI